MKRLYYTLASDTQLIIMPEITSHLDGHPIISYTYNVFLNTNKSEAELLYEEINIPDRDDNPDYFGKIVFENPGRLFNYEEGNRSLTRAEIEEVIEYISHVRDNPSLWKNDNL